jgi:hypothetical protein
MESIIGNGTINIEIQVHQSQKDRPLPPLFDKVTFHFDSYILGSGMLQIDNLGIENHTQPIHTQNTKEVQSLEFMPPLPLGMFQGIIVKVEYGFGGEGIGIFR